MARRLDEARGRDRLAGRGGMTEPESPDGAGIVVCVLEQQELVLDEAGVEVVVDLLVGVPFRRGAVTGALPGAVAVLLRGALGRGDELREHSSERVDLVASKLRPGRRPH